jgi:hypothetical protein
VDCTYCAGTTVLEGAIAIAMGGRALRESGAGAVGDELAMRLTGWSVGLQVRDSMRRLRGLVMGPALIAAGVGARWLRSPSSIRTPSTTATSAADPGYDQPSVMQPATPYLVPTVPFL